MFQLKHVITTRVREERDPHPAAVGLLAVLARLGESRVSELARLRMVDTSVVSRQVAQLEKAGLVERRACQDDARAQLVTAHGLEMLDGWRACSRCRWWPV